jgi:hypothetical protein
MNERYFGRFLLAKLGFGRVLQWYGWLLFPMIAKRFAPTIHAEFACFSSVFDETDFNTCMA